MKGHAKQHQHQLQSTLVALFCTLFNFLFLNLASAAEIGRVDTRFRPLSPDDTIRVESFEDPKVQGVVCYLSRAQVGGYSGAMGMAEDTSDASIDCRQVGPIVFLEPFSKGENVFRERRSLIFKTMKVIRYCDVEHNSLVYLVYSERVIEGSPKNSVSAVPIRAWGNAAESVPRCSYQD